jgi:hypothetical protein
MIQSAASNAEASTTPNPMNFPGETPNGTVPVGDNSEGEDGGGQGDGGFSGGGGGVNPPVIVDPVSPTNSR